MGGSVLPSNAPVVGLLFGTNDGVTISVCDNTDVVLEKVGSDYSILSSDVERRQRLWTTVYQHFRLIGWYSFGKVPAALHYSFHSTIESFVPNPLFLLLDNSPDKEEFGKIPIQAFRATAGLGAAASKVSFKPLPFKIDSPEVEKLAVDEIIKSVPHGAGSSLENFNENASVSLTALEQKIDILLQVLQKMQNGELEWNPEVARNATAICQSLGRMNSEENRRRINDEVTESLLSLYLGAATKSFASVNDLNSLYSILYAHDREGGGHRK